MNDHEYKMSDAFASVMANVAALGVDEDERYKLEPDDIDADWPVTAFEDEWEVLELETEDHIPDPVQCGTCELWWDDAMVTSMTPAPSARCPFEQFHRDEIDVDSYVLCVDTEIVRDVMIAVGGPTRYLRFVCSGNETADCTADYLNELECIRVEYHDSWAVPSSITLSPDEERAAIDAFGYLVGVE